MIYLLFWCLLMMGGLSESQMKITAAFVAIANNQAQALVPFYEAVLGCSPTVHVPQVYSEFQLPGLRLGIFNPKVEHQSEFRAAAFGSMSLCLEVENLERAIAHLADLGYAPPGPIQSASHGQEVYAYDPSGNRLILHQAKPDPAC